MMERYLLDSVIACVAGIGETCSHVASLLWVIGTGVENRDSLTVTQKSVMPPGIKSVPYA